MAIGAPDGKIALSIKEDQRIHCRWGPLPLSILDGN
jgi:hypothetical protein